MFTRVNDYDYIRYMKGHSGMDERLFSNVEKAEKIAGLIIFVACFIIPLSPAITMRSGGVSKTYGNTYSFVFGGKIEAANISYKTIGISSAGLALFIMVFVSFAALIGSFFVKNDKKNISKILIFGSSLLAIAFSILALSSRRSFSDVLADALISGHSDAVRNTVFNNTSLEFGVWGIAIFGFLAAFALLASLVFDGTLDKLRAWISIG